MLLAGGEGKRLGQLTKWIAKPAIPFAGKYRIIDFTLSNCANSGIDTVGVLTQYQPLLLNSYLGVGEAWDLNRKQGGLTILPPYVQKEGGRWYKGTANALYENISFIEAYQPEHVLVISGDHIYTMDYQKLLTFHLNNKAAATISVIEVPPEEASRFGIIKTDEDSRIDNFEEKPPQPQSNLASMGVYIFNWKLLKKYLLDDEHIEKSDHDFGKDIIPAMLQDNLPLYAYPFEGYWKDVGTIESLWQANLDMLDKNCRLNLNDRNWRIRSRTQNIPPHHIGSDAQISNSLINEGCIVNGKISNSVLFYGVEVKEGANITDSVLMPDVKVGKNVSINRTIIAEGTIIPDGATVGQIEGSIDLIHPI